MNYIYAIQEGQEFTVGRTENLLRYIRDAVNGNSARRLVYFSAFKEMQQAIAIERKISEMTWEEKHKFFKQWQVSYGILAGGPGLENVRDHWSAVGPIIA